MVIPFSHPRIHPLSYFFVTAMMSGVLAPHITNSHYLHYLVFHNLLISNVPKLSFVVMLQLVSVALL
jgi:hypothetical protein